MEFSRSRRVADSLLENQHLNPVRSPDPASILDHALQFVFQYIFLLKKSIFVLRNDFGERNPPFRNNDVARSDLDPMSLFAAALTMENRDIFTAPGAIHIHFGVSSFFFKSISLIRFL